MAGRGRPKLKEGEFAKNVSVTLTDEEIEFLRWLGKGNRSAAVRELIRYYKSEVIDDNEESSR